MANMDKLKAKAKELGFLLWYEPSFKVWATTSEDRITEYWAPQELKTISVEKFAELLLEVKRTK